MGEGKGVKMEEGVRVTARAGGAGEVVQVRVTARPRGWGVRWCGCGCETSQKMRPKMHPKMARKWAKKCIKK